ncbi:hypothetical protein AKJ09_02699 [Labilithrix luteola]|uniref:Lipoprotein n=1 Tax=Labilithrix luteola TaxID=1391654 RepID=A0A0K1PR66_9BACT|nr:hypothetical protein [Labilithrix luteola]AKU96035.1 hypothetical protein AKJ09_02699 [Labilithrix luteola]
MRCGIRTCGCALALTMVAAACSSSENQGGTDASTSPPTGLSPGDQALYDEVQPAAELGRKASDDFEGYVHNGALDPVAALEANLRSNADVANVGLRETSGTLTATLRSGARANVFVAGKERAEWSPMTSSLAARISSPLLPASGGSVRCTATTYPRVTKACLVSAFTESFGQRFDTIQASLERVSFTIERFGLKTADDLATLLAALDGCGVLYVSTQGALMTALDGTLGSHLVTEIEFGEGTLARISDVLGRDRVRDLVGLASLRGKTYWTLAPTLFANVAYPNSVVFVDAPSSAGAVAPSDDPDARSLRDVFRQGGAGAFYGWESTANGALSNPTADQLFQALVPKKTDIDKVSLTVTPVKVEVRQPYVPHATVSPPKAGVELDLSITGTDGFSRQDRQTTDATGAVTFESVPGAEEGVIDTLIVTAGGANDTATALKMVQASPSLVGYRLPWGNAQSDVEHLALDGRDHENLVCASSETRQDELVLNFGVQILRSSSTNSQSAIKPLRSRIERSAATTGSH